MCFMPPPEALVWLATRDMQMRRFDLVMHAKKKYVKQIVGVQGHAQAQCIFT